jgi:hypothetical protein
VNEKFDAASTGVFADSGDVEWTTKSRNGSRSRNVWHRTLLRQKRGAVVISPAGLVNVLVAASDLFYRAFAACSVRVGIANIGCSLIAILLIVVV